jgi:5-methylcytosine-specific restriction endonuclease McrA
VKRDTPAMKSRLLVEPRCRVCRSNHDVQVHHIVPRRITQCDDATNLVPLCFRCHQSVHDNKLDLLGALSTEEQAKAVLLTKSIESARMLLGPSAYRVAA